MKLKLDDVRFYTWGFYTRGWVRFDVNYNATPLDIETLRAAKWWV